ncbi:MAG: DUF2203 domain-containing protein [Chloroflexota bacterium]|jgi:hypothetical protein|nr:DUF2203 domain-containing protein [Chloroflexota bacterium]
MATDHTYTVEEARRLLPQVRATLLQLAVERQRADASHESVHALLDHLDSLGVVVRDLETGLVDFPTIRDGEPAWLCWRLADPELAWWHTTSEGFSSRRPL